MLTLAGEKKAGAKAATVLEIETQIARSALAGRETARARSDLQFCVPARCWNNSRPDFRGSRFSVHRGWRANLSSSSASSMPSRRWPGCSNRSPSIAGGPYFKYQYLSATADVLPAAFDAERV